MVVAFHRKLKVRIAKIQNTSFGLFIWGALSIRKEYTFVRQESIMLLVQYVEYRVSMVVGHEFIVVYEKSFAFLPGVTINLNKTVLKAGTTAAITFYLLNSVVVRENYRFPEKSPFNWLDLFLLT